MAVEDNDVFDRAFEAAEAKIAENELATESESAPVEQPKEDLVETQEISKAIEKVTKPAEKAPKVKAAKPSAKSAEITQEAQPEVTEQISDQQPTDTIEPLAAEQSAVTETIDPPQFWSADKKALFAKATPDLQKAIVEHEAQRNEYVHRLANESERGRAIEKRVSDVFKPYELKLKAHGINDPLQAAERLMAWNEIIESDPLTAVKTLMQRNGLTPQDLMYQDDGSGQPQQPYQSDPRVDEAIAKAEAAERRLQEWQQQQEAQALQSEVDAFKNSKDSTGQTRKAFAEMYAPQIAQAVEAISRLNPNLGTTERLTQAYDYVQAEVKKLLGVPAAIGQKPTAKPEQLVANAKKAQAAASSITGAPSSGTSPQRPGAKTFDEAYARAEERLGL